MWRRNALLSFLGGFSALADARFSTFSPQSGDERRESSSSVALSGASARVVLPCLVEKDAVVGGGDGGRAGKVASCADAEVTAAAAAEAVASASRGNDMTIAPVLRPSLPSPWP